MPTEGVVFQGDPSKLEGVDIDGPLREAKEPCCDYFGHAYSVAATEAEKVEQHQEVAVYHFLRNLTECSLSPDTPEQPFVPLFSMGARRTFVPADLTPQDLPVVKALADMTRSVPLRARLYDILWEAAHDHRALAKAAEAYCLSGKALCGNSNWVYGVKEYHRAIQLSSKLGTESEIFRDCLAAIEREIQASMDLDEVFAPVNLMEILLRYHLGDPSNYAPICTALAQQLLDQEDHYSARCCLELEAKWHRAMRNEQAEMKAKQAIGDSFVAEARNKAAGEKPSYLVAAHFLTCGIEALRQARAPRERIEELRRELSAYQEGTLNEMGTISHKVDITEAVRVAQAGVRAETFQKALFKFALGHPLSEPVKLREEALTLAKEHPLTHLIPRLLVDSKGRTVAKRNGIIGSTDDPNEEEIDALVFENVGRVHWGVRAEAYINPAREQVINDHHPTFADLAPLVQFNPFVPPGHEHFFLRGLHAGFHGDLVLASHLLTLQVENSIRFVLEASGVDVSNLLSDGTQPVKILGTLLALPETAKVFGEDVVFELRGHLIEKTGYDFRNRLAHGFVTDDECNSVPALSLWWIVLRICLLARIGRLPGQVAKKATAVQEPE